MEREVDDGRLQRLVFRLRAGSIVIISLGFLGGLAIGRVGVRQTWDGWQSSSWSTTAGVITTAGTSFATQTTTRDDPVQRQRGIRQNVTTDVWNARLTYSFESGGRRYEGHRIGVADVASDKYSDATDIVKRYAPGTSVTVYIHPTDPTQSVLEPGITFGAVGPLIIGAVLCFCMGCLASGVMSKRFVSLIDGIGKPSGSYLVGEAGRLVAVKRKGKRKQSPDKPDPSGSA